VVARSRHFQLLVADDDPGVRETLVEMLQPDFETLEAESGEEAIELVTRREIHLVLFDVHMPLLTGLEALRVVKRIRAELPCILMSANWDERLQAEAFEAHAHTVLHKPMTRRELVTTVTTALDDAWSEVWSPESESDG
jgi:CheY-like chemotaxis protein